MRRQTHRRVGWRRGVGRWKWDVVSLVPKRHPVEKFRRRRNTSAHKRSKQVTRRRLGGGPAWKVGRDLLLWQPGGHLVLWRRVGWDDLGVLKAGGVLQGGRRRRGLRSLEGLTATRTGRHDIAA